MSKGPSGRTLSFETGKNEICDVEDSVAHVQGLVLERSDGFVR